MVHQRKQSPIAREKTFYINFYSKVLGVEYKGEFTATRPNVIQNMEIEGRKSRILGGHYYDSRNPGCGVSPMAAAMSEMIAFLQLCLTDYPDWWNEGEVDDPEIIWKIYEEAQTVDPFRDRVEFLAKESGESLEPSGSGSDQERNNPKPPDHVASMVDEEVQASPEFTSLGGE